MVNQKIYSFCDKTSNLEIDVEDSVDALMIMKNKMILNLHLDYITNPAIRYLKIYGYKKIYTGIITRIILKFLTRKK